MLTYLALRRKVHKGVRKEGRTEKEHRPDTSEDQDKEEYLINKILLLEKRLLIILTIDLILIR